MIFYVSREGTPLTLWQRRCRFTDMRQAQFNAACGRQLAENAQRGLSDLTRTPSRNSALVGDRHTLMEMRDQAATEAAQWEHLAKWLGASVREG